MKPSSPVVNLLNFAGVAGGVQGLPACALLAAAAVEGGCSAGAAAAGQQGRGGSGIPQGQGCCGPGHPGGSSRSEGLAQGEDSSESNTAVVAVLQVTIDGVQCIKHMLRRLLCC